MFRIEKISYFNNLVFLIGLLIHKQRAIFVVPDETQINPTRQCGGNPVDGQLDGVV